MKRIYIAGAYSADNVIGVLDNMRRGMRAATEVLLAGYAPFVPWFDHQFHFMLREDEKLTVADYQRYSMAWLEASDAVMVVPGWENSKGTKAEIARAREIWIPVAHGFQDLRRMDEDGAISERALIGRDKDRLAYAMRLVASQLRPGEINWTQFAREVVNELVTETEVVAEYEHESAALMPVDKCATCAHEYTAKEEKLHALPPLAIIPGSEEECEAVQKRLFEYGYSWISDGQKFFCTNATVLFVEVNNDKYITLLYGPLDDAIDFTKEKCPQARIMTGAEFLREFPGK